MSGYLPQSESELASARPGSHQPGSLPPEAVLAGEKILYEARPSYRALHPVAFWGAVVVLAFFALVVVGGSLGNGYNLGMAASIGAFVFFPEVIVLAWVVSDARRTTYALTDQRAILRRGDDFTSAPYTDIAQVEAKPRSASVVFTLAPDPAAPTGYSRGQSRPLVWRAVRGAPAVAAFAMSATRFYSLRQRQKVLRQDIVTASLEDKVVCEYCRAYIPISTLNPNDPRCPRCAAPIAVAPLGM